MIKKLCVGILCSFLLIFCFTLKGVNASTLQSTYDYTSTITIDSDNVYMGINENFVTNDNIRNLYYEYEAMSEVSYAYNKTGIYIEVNGNIYNQIIVQLGRRIGGIEVFLFNTGNGNSYILFAWYRSIDDFYTYNNSKVNFVMRNNEEYTISIDDRIYNQLFNFYVHVQNGYYTSNRSLTNISNLTFATELDEFTTFSLRGSLVYASPEGYYFFDHIKIDMNSNFPRCYLYLSFPNGSNYEEYLISSQYENREWLRSWYLSNQYMDYYLYEWLDTNGIWEFNYASVEYDASFWDIINPFINMPATIMKSFLDISIYNTGVSILGIVATFITIVIAIKVVRMVKG